jgi:D-3-phosphoglycerate dehydrogenase
MAKVLIADELSPRAIEIFGARGIAVDFTPGLEAAELKRRIGQYDGLAVRSATKVTGALIAAAERLEVIGRAGIGVDNIDVAAATQRGIVVMNTPYGNSITAAEHTIAMMFALARQIPAADRSTQAGRWEKSRFMGVELSGKTLGIVGCGNVGGVVADRALGLKMKVVAYDPFLSPERAVALGVDKVGLDELYARADFISLHTPLNETTRNMIDAAALARMKRGVRLVNCARGGLVVEDDLARALDMGQVAAAAIDVFAEEPAKRSPLFGRDNVVATPHLGAATSEAQENVAVQIAEQMADFLLTGAVANAVNMPSLSAEEARRLKPYMKLAEQLGSFAGQLTESGLRAVAVEYEGAVAELNTKPLTAIALTGLLSPQLATARSRAGGQCAVCAQLRQAGLYRRARQYFGRGGGQYRDFSSRAHRAGRGCDRAGRGRPAVDPAASRTGSGLAERDPGQGPAVLNRPRLPDPYHSSRMSAS